MAVLLVAHLAVLASPNEVCLAPATRLLIHFLTSPALATRGDVYDMKRENLLPLPAIPT